MKITYDTDLTHYILYISPIIISLHGYAASEWNDSQIKCEKL